MRNNFFDRKIDVKDIAKPDIQALIRDRSRELLGPLKHKDVERQEKIFNFIFTALLKIVENRTSKPDLKQIKILISNSKNDLKLANEAFLMRDYNNTLFHLQQSIEKLVKAYGLNIGVIKNPKNEIGHNTPEVYIKLLSQSWVSSVPEILDLDIDTRIESLKKIAASEKSKAEMDRDVGSLLRTHKKVVKKAEEKLSERDFKTVLTNVKRSLGVDIKTEILNQIQMVYFLVPFSFITSIYAVAPRYEDESKYKDLKVIKHFTKIKSAQEKTIKIMEKHINRG